MLPSHPPSSAAIDPSIGLSPVPRFDRLTWRDLVQLAEVLLFVIGFTFFSGAMSVGPEQAVTSTVYLSVLPESMLSLLRYLIWGGAIGFIFASWRSVLGRMQQTPLLWGFIAVVLLSGYWSISPDFVHQTNREVIQMACFALFVVLRFPFRRMMHWLTICFGLGALGSAFVAVVVPAIGQHTIDHVGAWKGLYNYKNTLGSTMIMGLFSFYLQTAKAPFQKVYRWSGVALCFALILLCTSKTALVLVMIILLLIWFYRRYRWRGTWSMALTSLGLPVVACSAFLMFLNWVPLVQGLGKDPTISGRTQIWGAVLDSIWDRPWFGFGRSAFWQPGSVYALRAGERVGHLYVPPHGHNGLLDLLLDVGFVGVFLFLVLFLWVYGQSLWLAYHAQSLEDYWPAVYLPFLAMNNMTESYLLRLENPYWVLFMLVALSLPPLVRQRQQSLGAIGAGAN